LPDCPLDSFVRRLHDADISGDLDSRNDSIFDRLDRTLSAIGTDARRYLGILDSELLGSRDNRSGFTPEPISQLSAVALPVATEKCKKSRRETSIGRPKQI
jgi:hypothetical protein